MTPDCTDDILVAVCSIVVVISKSVDFNVITDQNDTIQSSFEVIWTRFGESNTNLSTLQIWNIERFWRSSMALEISNKIFQQFMDTSQRARLFDFAVGRCNEKIKGNDYMYDKQIMCTNKIFSYCKYEYKMNSHYIIHYYHI